MVKRVSAFELKRGLPKCHRSLQITTDQLRWQIILFKFVNFRSMYSTTDPNPNPDPNPNTNPNYKKIKQYLPSQLIYG